MPVLSTILLLFAAYGLGRFLIPKEGTRSPASLEGMLVTTSVGLALFPLLLIFGWLLGLPVITWIPLVLGLILMGLTFRTWWVDGRPFHHDHWDAAALGLGVVSLSVYLIGAYRDPWIGGLDGWEHTVTIRYILDTGSLDEPFAGMNILHYTDAYPPAFDLVGAAVTWLSGSVYHAVKLIGCFFPALCIPLLHFLVRRMTGDSRIGLLAALFLAVIPSHLTHHIWAHSYSLSLGLAALVAMVQAMDDPRWKWPAAILLSGVLLGGISSAVRILVMGGIMGLAAFGRSRHSGKRVFAVLILGVTLSLLWWGPMVVRYRGVKELAGALSNYREARAGPRWWGDSVAQNPWVIVGSAKYEITLKSVLVPPFGEGLPAPQGLGVGLALLALLGMGLCLQRMAFSPEGWWRAALLGWTAFNVAGVLGPHLPIRFDEWRFWMSLAIVASFLASLGLVEGLGRFRYRKGGWIILGSVFLFAIMTSLPWRLYSNLSRWEPKMFMNEIETAGYVKFGSQFPPGAAYPLSGDAHFDHIIGYDRECPFWKREVWDFQETHKSMTADAMASWLRQQGFHFVLFDEVYRKTLGVTAFQDRINEFSNSSGFKKIWGMIDENKAPRFTVFEVTRQ